MKILQQEKDILFPWNVLIDPRKFLKSLFQQNDFALAFTKKGMMKEMIRGEMKITIANKTIPV